MREIHSQLVLKEEDKMKKKLLTTALFSLLVGTTAIASMGSSAPCYMSQTRGEQTGHMMGQGMMGHGMMGHGMMGMGMMDHQAGHLFFLDRADELGLSSEQVDKLKTLQTECRRDNIRNVAELKIVRLELADLLVTENWSLQDAEKLVRKVQKMEGDIQVRHLQALNAARKILTEEQLKQARSGETSGDLESLFQ